MVNKSQLQIFYQWFLKVPCANLLIHTLSSDLNTTFDLNLYISEVHWILNWCFGKAFMLFILFDWIESPSFTFLAQLPLTSFPDFDRHISRCLNMSKSMNSHFSACQQIRCRRRIVRVEIGSNVVRYAHCTWYIYIGKSIPNDLNVSTGKPIYKCSVAAIDFLKRIKCTAIKAHSNRTIDISDSSRFPIKIGESDGV